MIQEIIFFRRFLFILLLIIFGSSDALAQKPDWVTKRPISKLYHIGIGIAAKNSDDPQDRSYLGQAKNSALNDIASQMKVKIAGEIINLIEEKGGEIAGDIKKQIQASTDAELEEVEIVDSWETEKEYWIYYRLSKAKLEEKKNNATRLALDFFDNAQQSLKSGKISKALLYLIQAIGSIEKYIGEPLEVEYEGASIYLTNEIYYSLNMILSQIELRPENNNQQAQTGKAVRRPLIAYAVYTDDDGSEVPVGNLPLNFSFIRGKGDLFEKVHSDRKGRARCKISKIESADRVQIVGVGVDIRAILGQGEISPITAAVIKCLSSPSSKFIINVSGLSVAAKVTEIHFGKKLSLSRIEPQLKNALTEMGFVFVEDVSGADIVIEINAESIPGSERIRDTDMYSAFASLNISVLNLSSGEEVYKNSLERVAGFGLDFNKAGLNSFEKAAERLRTELIPEMVQQLYR